MEDLSSLAENSMWPSSQAAGNMMSGRKVAMSAPGTQPVDPLPPAKDQGEPVVESISYDPAGRVHVLNDEGGHQIPDENKGRPTLFTRPDSTGIWRKA